jgi:hypothetical protein
MIVAGYENQLSNRTRLVLIPDWAAMASGWIGVFGIVDMDCARAEQPHERLSIDGLISRRRFFCFSELVGRKNSGTSDTPSVQASVRSLNPRLYCCPLPAWSNVLAGNSTFLLRVLP